jgi:hypothetical protein
MIACGTKAEYNFPVFRSPGIFQAENCDKLLCLPYKDNKSPAVKIRDRNPEAAFPKAYS